MCLPDFSLRSKLGSGGPRTFRAGRIGRRPDTGGWGRREHPVGITALFSNACLGVGYFFVPPKTSKTLQHLEFLRAKAYRPEQLGVYLPQRRGIQHTVEPLVWRSWEREREGACNAMMGTDCVLLKIKEIVISWSNLPNLSVSFFGTQMTQYYFCLLQSYSLTYISTGWGPTFTDYLQYRGLG